MADGQFASKTPLDFRALVNREKATVDRVIFSDQDIYQLELERIFARAWNFMCHESQISKPGDFFLSFIGDDSVIATRDKKGNLQVLLNTCRHRGNAVCRAEQGHANSFLCTYHGWTYGLDGKLIGVPGFKDFYHEDLDRSQWGLIAAPKVASYKGFVFASMDPEAPDLEEYLGPVGRIGIDMIAERGDVVAVDGVQKSIIGCNWKLAVDNIYDYYHPGISHASAMMTGAVVRTDKPRPPMTEHLVMFGEYGHGIGGPRITQEARDFAAGLDPKQPNAFFDFAWRDRPEAKAALGPAGYASMGHPNIFPNFWVTEFGQVSLRLPRGPLATEIWWFTFVDKNLSPEARKAYVHSANHVFGPAGMLEQEDGENWDQSTRATKSTMSKRYPLNFAMSLGRGEIKKDSAGTPYADTKVNEHCQFWTYIAWADWMAAPDWATLKRDHAPVPTERI